MPHTHYPQPAGGFGGLFAPAPPAPFSFPEIFQSYSGSTPTIGKKFEGTSTSTVSTSTTCPNSFVADYTTPSPDLTDTGALNLSAAGAAPTQGKICQAWLTFKLK
jgi:hypothetical protein